MASDGRDRLIVVPMTFRQACAWVTEHHRHNKAPRGHKFSIGIATDDGVIHGVAMVGRPLARSWDNGWTAEVLRTCTDGTPNANSALYGAAWRICREMGYLRVVTYTQGDEPGTSLRGAGWRLVGTRPPRGSWLDSTADPRLRAMRDSVGNGGLPRTVWERAAW